MSGNIYVYIMVSALVSFAVRVLPLTLIRKKIEKSRHRKGKRADKPAFSREKLKVKHSNNCRYYHYYVLKKRETEACKVGCPIAERK